MLESTFLGLWVFGWNRLSPRLHLATLWVAVLGTWLSGYFILVANSWMQHPVGYKIVNGQAQLTSVWALLSNGFALRAYLHTMLAGLIFGTILMLGVCCWHFLRSHEVDLFRKAAKLALIVAVPVTLLQLIVGNRFGEAVTSAQSMKIAASEAQWNTCDPCGFSLFQIGGFTESGYAYGQVFIEALKRGGKELTREGFMANLDQMSNFTGSLVPSLSYSPTDHAGVKAAYFQSAKDGKFVNVTGFITLK